MIVPRYACTVRHLKNTVLATATLLLPAHAATAAQFVRMKQTIWGCVDPNVTPALNDPRDPRSTSASWIARLSEEGHCVTISPRSLWQPLSKDFAGLTYVAYRGITARPGAFWVPTASIDFNPPPEAPFMVIELARAAPRTLSGTAIGRQPG